jgi:hypothetical protein
MPLAYFLGRDVGQRPGAELRENVNFYRVLVVDEGGRFQRNLAIGALRLAGRTDVTEAARWAARSMDRPFTILGLT